MLKQLFTKLFHKDDKPETFDFIAEPGEEYIDLSNMIDVYYKMVYDYTPNDPKNTLF